MEWHEGTCYLNGKWMPLADASISVLDRGFIFGDGVYEVIPVDTVDGIRAPFHARPHYARLQRSLDAVRISNPLFARAVARPDRGADRSPSLAAPADLRAGNARRGQARPSVPDGSGADGVHEQHAVAADSGRADRQRRVGGDSRRRALAALRHQEHLAARQRADEAVRHGPRRVGNRDAARRLPDGRVQHEHDAREGRRRDRTAEDGADPARHHLRRGVRHRPEARTRDGTQAGRRKPNCAPPTKCG